ncbi:hypothetical protein ScPMuIL_004820 [Solemya velum]
MIWANDSIPNPHLPSPLDYRWRLKAITSDLPPAPSAFVELVKCGCSTSKCARTTCSCRKMTWRAQNYVEQSPCHRVTVCADRGRMDWLSVVLVVVIVVSCEDTVRASTSMKCKREIHKCKSTCDNEFSCLLFCGVRYITCLRRRRSPFHYW